MYSGRFVNFTFADLMDMDPQYVMDRTTWSGHSLIYLPDDGVSFVVSTVFVNFQERNWVKVMVYRGLSNAKEEVWGEPTKEELAFLKAIIFPEKIPEDWE